MFSGGEHQYTFNKNKNKSEKIFDLKCQLFSERERYLVITISLQIKIGRFMMSKISLNVIGTPYPIEVKRQFLRTNT